MSLIDALKKKKAPAGPKTLPADHTLHKEDYKVVGVQYHEDAIKRLQIARDDYRAAAKKNIEAGLAGQRIWRYDYVNKPVDLKPDPSDRFGTDRIMVFIAGQHVGYISEEDDDHVLEILRFGSVKYITARISGGDYKVVALDGDTVKLDDRVRISVRIAYSV